MLLLQFSKFWKIRSWWSQCFVAYWWNTYCFCWLNWFDLSYCCTLLWPWASMVIYFFGTFETTAVFFFFQLVFQNIVALLHTIQMILFYFAFLWRFWDAALESGAGLLSGLGSSVASSVVSRPSLPRQSGIHLHSPCFFAFLWRFWDAALASGGGGLL